MEPVVRLAQRFFENGIPHKFKTVKMVEDSNTSDEISYSKKGRHRAKQNPKTAFKMEGTALYLFSAFIIVLMFLSIFILYDNWLYQSSYEKLTNIWIQYENDQKALDRLTHEMTDKAITFKDMSKKIARTKEDINKTDEKLEKIKISNRHLELVALKKELALLTGDLYKIGKRQDEVIGDMENNVDNKALLDLREQNIKVFKREEGIVKIFQKTIPFERKIYEGLTATSLLAAIKGS